MRRSDYPFKRGDIVNVNVPEGATTGVPYGFQNILYTDNEGRLKPVTLSNRWLRTLVNRPVRIICRRGSLYYTTFDLESTTRSTHLSHGLPAEMLYLTTPSGLFWNEVRAYGAKNTNPTS